MVEDLNVTGMLQLRSLARAVSDASMSELGHQLSYKADWYGLQLVVADRWFPSSKTCHHCSDANTGLTLADRSWACTACGTTHDRDYNAAVNLARWPAQQAATAAPASQARSAEPVAA